METPTSQINGSALISRREFGRMAGAMGLLVGTSQLPASAANCDSMNSGAGFPDSTRYGCYLDELLKSSSHREAWSKAYLLALDWAKDRLTLRGITVDDPHQKVSLPKRGMTKNLIANLGPTGTDSGRTYTICAHLDSYSRSVPGGNDNGSGVAAVLEIAAAFADFSPRLSTLKFVLFGGEEKQLEGSFLYSKLYKNMSSTDLRKHRVINIDTIGTAKKLVTDPSFALEYAYPESATIPPRGILVTPLLAQAKAGTVSEAAVLTPYLEKSSHQSDHLAFLERFVPAVSISSYNDDGDMHTSNDDYNHVNQSEAFGAVDWLAKYLRAELIKS